MQTLESRIAQAGSAAQMLYHSQDQSVTFPLPAEFTNWRDEQEAWHKTAAFQDMSFHMFELVLEGPDTIRLLSDFGINSFARFGPMQAKQYVVCNSDGFYIGDAILTCEEPDKVCLVGKSAALHWIRFQLERGHYDAKVTHFGTPSPRLSDRRLFRYQVQGPAALRILEEVHGGPLPDIGFFKMGRFTLAGHEVTALNHRMSGAPGFEFWGPSEWGPAVKEAILAAGRKYGLRQIGAKVFRVTAMESGWIGTALPAIYTGEATRAFREWLPADTFEGRASFGGSFPLDDFEELYVRPSEIGYGFMTKFDHEFCGRAALEKAMGKPIRKKVRLIWNSDDVLGVHASMYGENERAKYMEMPVANYANFLADEVTKDGRRVGFSLLPVYSAAARAWISLAVLDEKIADSAGEVVVTWGEPDGGSTKPGVERHVQRAIRARIEEAVRRA
ncbi:aminomethyl transferase family protein [Chelativorans sp. SCAU2101]|uniref:Aminomethyl transferase family protein n=1 Tax=Chelativorans petroleitrophicus TaxID=2975484 RepID=A0A9X2XA29_9HYPH|nr:aminomethyl transferase family protein [Chelativorans petroleitrophicus]MCT8991503.1 aminomethyl transferase family protein [Chelativorans petroleitrophicus]